jgi:hypothetical protein
MPLSVDELRQLLTDHSDPGRYRPAPQERLTVRIRRARIRRAAGASLLAVVAAAGAVGVAAVAHEHASGHAPSYSGPPFPASFTASDGAFYHQVAVTSMAEPAQKSATLAVAAASYPVDVMGACDAPQSGAFVAVKVNGVLATYIKCQKSPQLIGLPVGPGHQADITFTEGSIPGLPFGNADWRFAAYQWIPPVTARAAPPEPRLPLSYTGDNTTIGQGMALRRMIASRSGDWPGDRTVTVTVPYRGRNLDISIVCAGAIAGRLQVSLQVDGSNSHTEVPCISWTPGQQPQDSTGVSGRVGIPMTLTFRIQAPGTFTADYAKRAASWTIAIYEEEF